MISYLDILLRFGLAMLIGVVVGLERQHAHHPAGLRTHVLVALSACVIMTTGQLIMIHMRQYGGGFDPARMACQVIPGIGFLGAGSIIHARGSTKGITTAAGLWSTACIGLCAGAGFYTLAILGAAILLLILTVMKDIRTPNGYAAPISTAEIKLVTPSPTDTEALIRRLAGLYNGQTKRITLKRDDDSQYAGNATLTAQVRFVGTERDQNMQAFGFALSTALHTRAFEITMIRK